LDWIGLDWIVRKAKRDDFNLLLQQLNNYNSYISKIFKSLMVEANPPKANAATANNNNNSANSDDAHYDKSFEQIL